MPIVYGKDQYDTRASSCGCGGPPQGGCTLAAPQPYVHACHPAPLHRHACQSDAYFTLGVAYGQL